MLSISCLKFPGAAATRKKKNITTFTNFKTYLAVSNVTAVTTQLTTTTTAAITVSATTTTAKFKGNSYDLAA